MGFFKSISFISLVLLCIFHQSIFAQAKNVQGISGNYNIVNPRIKPKIHGDSIKAQLALHKKNSQTYISAHLGFIDSVYASEEEVRNNVEIGLLISPSNSYEIASYCITIREINIDPIGLLCVEGNKINNKIFEMIYSAIKSKTELEFTNIRMRKKDTEITMPLPNFWIKVR